MAVGQDNSNRASGKSSVATFAGVSIFVLGAAALVLTLAGTGGRNERSEIKLPHATSATGLISIQTPGLGIPDHPAQLDESLKTHLQQTEMLIQTSPNDADHWGKLGMLYEVHGYADHALSSYTSAASFERNQIRWKYMLAVLTYDLFDLADGEALMREIVEVRPDFLPGLERYGLMLANRGAHTEALDLFERVITLQPKHPQGYLRAAATCLSLNDPVAARSFITRAQELAPTDLYGHQLLGRILQHEGNTSQARVSLSKGKGGTLEVLPDPWRHELSLIAVTIGAGHFLATKLLDSAMHERAVPVLEALVKKNGNDVIARNNLAYVYIATSRLDNAQEQLAASLALMPNYAPTEVLNATLMATRNNFAAALHHVERAIELAPLSANAHALRAQILIRLNRSHDALQALREAARLDPENANYHVAVGDWCARLKRWSDAADAFETALRVARHQPSIYAKLGMVYSELRQFDKARSILKEGLHIAPENKTISSTLRKLNEVTRYSDG